ncbi:phosphoribosylformylglycinamidine synthase II [Salinarchaeum sp. Harcht-Bsk1]|uniref:phosphoribosylformylglycinamidine synthase subunit PurL n=1 Tax=Salinarchaeum sp. Harcht-Bsk1 TaxID=1333523 RepID=UPI0003422A31|nr:phosphoribosylformylglycinamidine synthase subunit PurL [Salinarchaeum sp. Harcht-Bsk1]AGN02249.1 phosphoribosylformylglycinamidine synthase II [Salinarchaeum sp. Harcht-Bsk1]
MPLAEADRELVVDELGREPTRAEAALFENLWSEHCAYRSSRPLLGAFDSEGERIVVGPGDDAAVVALPDPLAEEVADAAGDLSDAPNGDVYVTLGIESHNHPSYVDPYDGAATGVGGIVRDTLSMGAYPIALTDSLYFGDFDREHSRYLFEGVVEGIADYGNAIGVPTVGGSVDFHPDYEGNPLVNVACVGLTSEDRLVRAAVNEPGNKLVLVGNSTGRDGLGGASFASEDLDEDAETEDRPAVQVGDPYTEKLLIECNEQLVDEDLIEAARDLGAAGLGGASSEMAAQGGLGAEIDLEQVQQREPNMNAMEILLAESQERMCYEVTPENVERVEAVADRYDLGCSVIGEVTEGNYVCTFDGETVVDADAEFLGDGAPFNDFPMEEPESQPRDRPEGVDLQDAFEAVLASPNTASKEWVYRQYDHEVGTRTAVKPGDDAALMTIREAAGIHEDGDASGQGVGLAISAGAAPNWTDANPYEGARAVAVENATNLATTGATPLAAVNCLNGGNPEKPDVYGGFGAIVDGLADGCAALDSPVVGGNVSLYNDSVAGPIPPTPTLAMVGTRKGYDTPGIAAESEGKLLLVGGPALDEDGDAIEQSDAGQDLGGSEYLAQVGGTDRFPAVPDDPSATVTAIAEVARQDATLAVHDVSHGGLAVTLAEMVTEDAGLDVALPGEDPAGELFSEAAGRALVQTTDPAAVEAAFDGIAPVSRIGAGSDDGRLRIAAGDHEIVLAADEIAGQRSTIDRALD